MFGLPGNPGFSLEYPSHAHVSDSPGPGWRPLEPQSASAAAGDSGGWHLASRRGCGQRAGRTGRYPRDHCLQRQGERGSGGTQPGWLLLHSMKHSPSPYYVSEAMCNVAQEVNSEQWPKAACMKGFKAFFRSVIREETGIEVKWPMFTQG